MSDIQPETTTPDSAAAAEATQSDTADTASELTALAGRVDALETRVAALEARPAPATTTSGGAVFIPAAASFDAHARYIELVDQGLTEVDATAQAAYEERLWNDQHQMPPAA